MSPPTTDYPASANKHSNPNTSSNQYLFSQNTISQSTSPHICQNHQTFSKQETSHPLSSHWRNTNHWLIYKTLIQSKLDYGAVAYSSASQSFLNSLNTIQHTALRLACGAFWTTPSISILSDLGEKLLSYRRQRLLASYHIRIKLRPYLPLAIQQHRTNHPSTLRESFI